MKVRINLRVILLSLLNRSKRYIPPGVDRRDLVESFMAEGGFILSGASLSERHYRELNRGGHKPSSNRLEFVGQGERRSDCRDVVIGPFTELDGKPAVLQWTAADRRTRIIPQQGTCNNHEHALA